MDKPRIEVTMQVTTWMPQDQRFVVATLPRWIEDNAARAGLPYQLVPQGATERKVIAARPGVGIPLATTPDEQVAGAPTSGRRDRGERGEPNYDAQNLTREQMLAIQEADVASGRVQIAGRAQEAAPNPGRDSAGLDAIAPIDQPKPNEGFDKVTYTVRWLMVLAPAPAASGGQPSDANQGGGQ